MKELELYDDQQIIDGCRKNNRRYQEILYRKYAKKMYATCLSYAKDRAAAQDILQEGFIKVYKHINNFESKGSLEGWIRKIIVNTALDYLRKKQRSQKHIDDNVESYEKRFNDHIIERISSQEILGIVRRLPEGARMIFNLYALEGYTHKEISQKLDITEGTSKSQLNRAKELLKEWIVRANG